MALKRRSIQQRKTKDFMLRCRVTDDEQRGFQMAADLSGIGLSTWARERLRRAAVRELEEAGRSIPFIKPTI